MAILELLRNLHHQIIPLLLEFYFWFKLRSRCLIMAENRKLERTQKTETETDLKKIPFSLQQWRIKMNCTFTKGSQTNTKQQSNKRFIYLKTLGNFYPPGTVLACRIWIWIIGRLERATRWSQCIVTTWQNKRTKTSSTTRKPLNIALDANKLSFGFRR